MRKSGQRVRITGQLIDATTGNHIWAERYDRELSDIFALQDEITTSVIAAIEPKLLAAEVSVPNNDQLLTSTHGILSRVRYRISGN